MKILWSSFDCRQLLIGVFDKIKLKKKRKETVDEFSVNSQRSYRVGVRVVFAFFSFELFENIAVNHRISITAQRSYSKKREIDSFCKPSESILCVVYWLCFSRFFIVLFYLRLDAFSMTVNICSSRNARRIDFESIVVSCSSHSIKSNQHR